MGVIAPMVVDGRARAKRSGEISIALHSWKGRAGLTAGDEGGG